MIPTGKWRLLLILAGAPLIYLIHLSLLKIYASPRLCAFPGQTSGELSQESESNKDYSDDPSKVAPPSATTVTVTAPALYDSAETPPSFQEGASPSATTVTIHVTAPAPSPALPQGNQEQNSHIQGPFPPAQGPHRQSDVTDTFAEYKNAEQCGVSSLDLHMPFEPLCKGRREVLEAMSTGGRPGYDRFYIPSGCDMRWYSSQEIEDILSRFSHIFILGDSMMRHLTNAIYILLRGDIAYGGITDWDVPAVPDRNINEKKDCACSQQFAVHECSDLVIKDYQWLRGNSSGEELPPKLQEDFDMTYHVLDSWPLTDDDLNDITDTVPDEQLVEPPQKPFVFLLHNSLWNDVNTTATLNWISQIQDHLIGMMPWLWEENQFPRLFMTANAGGLSKSLFYMVTQSNAHLAKFERDIKPHVEAMGIDFLGMFNMSVQSTQPDGVHASFETNILKAQMVMNWLDRLETVEVSLN